jgi:hypothetical protein
MKQHVDIVIDFAQLPEPSRIAAKLFIQYVCHGRSTQSNEVDELLVLAYVWTYWIPFF